MIRLSTTTSRSIHNYDPIHQNHRPRPLPITSSIQLSSKVTAEHNTTQQTIVQQKLSTTFSLRFSIQMRIPASFRSLIHNRLSLKTISFSPIFAVGFLRSGHPWLWHLLRLILRSLNSQSQISFALMLSVKCGRFPQCRRQISTQTSLLRWEICSNLFADA